MPKRKEPCNNNNKEQVQNFVIKKALYSTCKNVDVFNKIQRDVAEMSALFVEVSRYIHFTLMKKWTVGDFSEIKFADYYYHLMQKKKPKYVVDATYASLRKHLPLYDSSYRSNLFIDSANQYSTLFHNNIWMHAYSRLRRFFSKFTQDHSKIYNTLRYLFSEDNELDQKSRDPDLDLLLHMTEELQWRGEKFAKLQNKKNYWASIKIFFNLQRFNERNNYKNFSMIPIFKHGAHHIRYDSFAYFNLLCSLKLFKGAWKDFNREEYWCKYFKLPKSQFAFSLQTDGVSVSFLMQKPNSKTMVKTKCVLKKKKEKNKMTSCKQTDYFSATKLEKIRCTKYINKIGLDPGLRLLYGGVRNGKPIKLKSSTYHHMSGFYSRKYKLSKITSKCPPNTKFSSNSINDLDEYIRYELEIFQEKQKIFSQRKVTRLKLQKFIQVEKTCQRLTNELAGDVAEQTLICIGSTEISSNSPIRGYIRTPHRKFIQALKERRNVDIIFINEFRTTKLCANCKSPENKTSQSPHRYQFCPNCNTCWNRDVNAGVNILYLGDCIISGTQKHENFQKYKSNTIAPTVYLTVSLFDQKEKWFNSARIQITQLCMTGLKGLYTINFL